MSSQITAEHVLEAMRNLHHLETVGETLRAALDDGAEEADGTDAFTNTILCCGLVLWMENSLCLSDRICYN